ncbi:DegV family protein [Eubacteriales bacterium OttesenSCG-928-N13]|nr:DegV family protein [Eubacteriales bacterium OttesenSCG-928-N13]
MQMNKNAETFRIIVDSCCDLTRELKARLGATSIPLTMRLGQQEFVDDDTLQIDHFMQAMKACAEKVGSASPAPLTYQQAMIKAGCSFVVTLSSKLSGSFASAMLGKTMALKEGASDTHVFDSKSASAGETLIAIKLHELIANGLGKDQIIESVSQFIDNMKTYFVLESYDNLYKNGRLGKVAIKIINLLGIKLIMGDDGNGSIAAYAKVRSEKQMLAKLLAFIEESGKKITGERIVISHCDNPGLAQRLADAIDQRFDFSEIQIVPTGGLSSLYADDKGVVMAF